MTRRGHISRVVVPVVSALVLCGLAGWLDPASRAQEAPATPKADLSAREAQAAPSEKTLISALREKAQAEGATFEIGLTPQLQAALNAGRQALRVEAGVRGILLEAGAPDTPQSIDQITRLGIERVLAGTRPPADLLQRAEEQNARAEALLKLDPDAAEPPLRSAGPGVEAGGLPPISPQAKMFDWRFYRIVRIPSDQGGCGCCWAFGTAGAFEAADALVNRRTPLLDASEQQLLSCSGAGTCGGGWWAFPFIVNQGVTTDAKYPYLGGDSSCPGPFQPSYRALTWGYVSSATTIPSASDLKKALCQYGPLAIAVYASPNFVAYRGGVFNERSPLPVNHAILLVGWNDEGGQPSWQIKNSWGPNWGEGGFMRIAQGSNSVGFGAAWVRPLSDRARLAISHEAFRQNNPAARPLDKAPAAEPEPDPSPALRPVEPIKRPLLDSPAPKSP